jgi:hypothetical protein
MEHYFQTDPLPVLGILMLALHGKQFTLDWQYSDDLAAQYQLSVPFAPLRPWR